MKSPATLTIENGTNIRPAPVAVTPSSFDPAAQLAARAAHLEARLEEAIFERDLAQRVQERLEQEYRALAQNRSHAVTEANLAHNLDVVRREKQHLEQELQFAQQRADALESERLRLESEKLRLQAEIGNYDEYVQTLLNSRGWRLAQALRRLVGRTW